MSLCKFIFKSNRYNAVYKQTFVYLVYGCYIYANIYIKPWLFSCVLLNLIQSLSSAVPPSPGDEEEPQYKSQDNTTKDKQDCHDNIPCLPVKNVTMTKTKMSGVTYTWQGVSKTDPTVARLGIICPSLASNWWSPDCLVLCLYR